VKPAIEWPLRAIIDFAAPDACHWCGRPTGDPGRELTAARLPAPTRYLAGETTVPFLGNFTVVNHPMCLRCLAHLEPSRAAKRLGVGGVTGGVGWVQTAAGELFVHRPVGAAGAALDGPVGGTGSVLLEVCSAFRMNDASLKAIHLIKFSRRRSLVPLVAGAMAYALRVQRPVPVPAVAVPVPMHPSARRRRGFDQAELIATEISRLTGIPSGSGALRKTVRTRRQSTTKRDRRADNVRGVFRWDGGSLNGNHVLLVDDLVTSGATAASCASACLAAGAAGVTTLALATAL
jgi:ComF family protein